MTDKYILEGRETVPCPSLIEWARWFENADRRVGHDFIGKVRVSTVFLGVDHSFGRGPPELFETMIFGGPHDGYAERYSTWDEAEAGHKKALWIAEADRGLES